MPAVFVRGLLKPTSLIRDAVFRCGLQASRAVLNGSGRWKQRSSGEATHLPSVQVIIRPPRHGGFFSGRFREEPPVFCFVGRGEEASDKTLQIATFYDRSFLGFGVNIRLAGLPKGRRGGYFYLKKLGGKNIFYFLCTETYTWRGCGRYG